jgi:hypothetical protein
MALLGEPREAMRLDDRGARIGLCGDGQAQEASYVSGVNLMVDGSIWLPSTAAGWMAY